MSSGVGHSHTFCGAQREDDELKFEQNEDEGELEQNEPQVEDDELSEDDKSPTDDELQLEQNEPPRTKVPSSTVQRCYQLLLFWEGKNMRPCTNSPAKDCN